jgi:hypothetical protein
MANYRFCKRSGKNDFEVPEGGCRYMRDVAGGVLLGAFINSSDGVRGAI